MFPNTEKWGKWVSQGIQTQDMISRHIGKISEPGKHVSQHWKEKKKKSLKRKEDREVQKGQGKQYTPATAAPKSLPGTLSFTTTLRAAPAQWVTSKTTSANLRSLMMGFSHHFQCLRIQAPH
jgi:hypothetical protein